MSSSSSSHQEILVHGYCRTSPWDMIFAIVEIIMGYFVINDCWSDLYDFELLLCEDDTFCEWPWTCDIHDCADVHKSIFGNFMFQTGNYPQTIKLRWELEFCIRRHEPHPLFIGITNNNANISHAPFVNKRIIKNAPRNKMYTGFGFCFYNRDIDDPWCKTYSHHEDGVVFYADNAHDFKPKGIIKESGFIVHHPGFDHNELVFGEIEFIVILDGKCVSTSIKVFSHPHTLKNNDNEAFNDWKWSDFFIYNDHLNDLCFLSASIPCGSSIKMKRFDIYGHINFDFRKRIQSSHPIFSLYK